MADQYNGNKKLWNLASRCVVKNYNDVKRIADLNGDFGNHVVDTSNPHNVNKSQVGLGNVPNTDCTNPANITQSSSYRLVTDTEKATWNAKASTSVATTSVSGLMSSTDKTKLDGVATNANNYVHPVNHPASIITQDASNRFVTDTEKSTWNGKASTAIVTTIANGLMASEDKTKLDAISGSNTGDQDLSGYSLTGHTHTGTYEPADATILKDADIGSTVQGYDADLQAIGTLAGTTGLLKKTAADTWTLDTTAYTTNVGTVTGVSGTAPITSSGGSSPTISMVAATALVNGYMTNTYASKLDDIEANANNYVHPANHPASIITQDVSNRFVTDTEKSTWNAKSNFDGAYSSLTGTPIIPDQLSDLTDDATHRLVTDTEKSTWNSKADSFTGYTGSITVVTGVNFTAQTTTTSTITISNGIITGIS